MIPVPPPLPDELIGGYLGRVLRINGWEGKKSNAKNLLSLHVGHKTNFFELPLAQLLAKVARIEFERFLGSHSMYPLQRAVAKDTAGGLRGVGPIKRVADKMAFWVPRPRAYLCMACVKEDLSFHGISYWRREHQLLGYLSCSKHAEPLFSVDHDRRRIFGHAPSLVLNSATPGCPDLVECQYASKANIRFLDICSHFLVSGPVLNRLAVSNLALKKSQEMGLKVLVESTVLRSLFRSKEIRGAFDAKWFAHTMEESMRSDRSKPIESLGHVWRTSFACALIFGVMYPTAEGAINAMETATAGQASVDPVSKAREARRPA